MGHADALELYLRALGIREKAGEGGSTWDHLGPFRAWVLRQVQHGWDCWRGVHLCFPRLIKQKGPPAGEPCTRIFAGSGAESFLCCHNVGLHRESDGPLWADRGGLGCFGEPEKSNTLPVAEPDALERPCALRADLLRFGSGSLGRSTPTSGRSSTTWRAGASSWPTCTAPWISTFAPWGSSPGPKGRARRWRTPWTALRN